MKGNGVSKRNPPTGKPTGPGPATRKYRKTERVMGYVRGRYKMISTGEVVHRQRVRIKHGWK